MLTSPLTSAALMLAMAAPSASAVPLGLMPDSPHLAIAQDRAGATVRVPRVTVTTSTFVLRRERPPVPIERPRFDNCIKIKKINGFSVHRTNAIDLLLSDGKMLRVDLDNGCTALGFYSGFYVTPTKDQRICAGRDTFRSRSGRVCQIKRFHTLVPAR